MLQECMDGLDIKPGGVYVDVTFGGGGHTKAILDRVGEGQVVGFDQDPDAVQNAEKLNDKRLTLAETNFRNLKQYLRLHKATPADGILADLGISSYQIDTAERGFSTRQDGALDMRMDTGQSLSAASLVAEYDEEQLARVLWEYGEFNNSRALARAIAQQRAMGSIETTKQLMGALARFAPRGKENQFYARVFQALRIEVNDEIGALKDMLRQSLEVLKPGGRLVVMSYHSLEDRLVKNFMKSGNFEGDIEKDFYGNPLVPFKAITRKPITASAEELSVNSRARSAKLRIVEKI